MPNRIEVRSVTPSLIRDDSEQAIKQASGLSDSPAPNVYAKAFPAWRGCCVISMGEPEDQKDHSRLSSRRVT